MNIAHNKLLLFLLLLMLLLLGPAAGHQSEVAISQLIDKPASINLRSILEHQEALEAECAKYHDEKVRQLEYLVKFNEEKDNLVQLPQLLPVKVPAVCLFLFSSHFERPKPMAIGKSGASQKRKVANTKLEFVNWIYNKDEISGVKQQHKQAANMTKRQVEQPKNDILNEYLFNPSASANDYPLNEMETNEMVEFHKNVNTMMANERFHQIINLNRDKIATHLSPVILVPGLLGSRLQARTDKARRVNIFCSKQSDWQDMWLSIRLLLPLMVDCWLDNVRLEYEPLTGYARVPKGVESRVPDFGSIESVRHLDLRQPQLSRYFAPIIELYEQLGYTPDVNLLAAPYDFRRAPQELDDYYENLKMLIVRAQEESPSGKKVTLVCHSMGCTHLLVFLRKQSAAWRQSRIRKLIALASPWGGSMKTLKALVVGDQLNLPLVSEAKMRKLARSYPSMAFVLPQAQIFARPSSGQTEPGGPVLVQTPKKSYRVGDLEELLRDLNLTRQLEWFKSTSSLIKPLEPLPDLYVDCIHSLNIPTPETIIFRNQSDFPDGDYELVKGEGDGTVNFVSLMVCEDWAKLLPDKVKHKVIMNTDHSGLLSHKTLLTHITDDVLTN